MGFQGQSLCSRGCDTAPRGSAAGAGWGRASAPGEIHHRDDRSHGLRGRHRTFGVYLLGLALWGAGGVRTLAQRAPGPAEIFPAGATVAGPNYALQPSDLVEITVFQEDDLHSRLRVAKDGSLNLPLIGGVSTTGRTAEEVAGQIRRQLADGYLANPQVTVTVLAYSKRIFTVLGQVNRPGSYSLPDNNPLNLVQAIGVAGGYTRLAAPKRVLLKRVVNGRETLQRLDAERMARTLKVSALEILPGDTITVTESMF